MRTLSNIGMRASASWLPLTAEQAEAFPELSPAVQELAAMSLGRTRAAWLLWHYRRKLSSRGAFYVHVPIDVPAPKWFLLAMRTLVGSPKWAVDTMLLNGQRYYRVSRAMKPS